MLVKSVMKCKELYNEVLFLYEITEKCDKIIQISIKKSILAKRE